MPSLPIPSSVTSAATTRHAPSRAGSPGSTQLPTGCVRGVPRPSSSIRPTTPTRSSWHAGSTTMCELGYPRSSRFQSRSPPDHRLSSRPGPVDHSSYSVRKGRRLPLVGREMTLSCGGIRRVGGQARARPMRCRFFSSDPGRTAKCTCPSWSTAITRTTARACRLPATSITPGTNPGNVP